MARKEIAAVMGELGIVLVTEFIPHSKSRNKDSTNFNPTLNWRVKLSHNGRTVLEADYSTGCAHCPSYKQGRMSQDDRERVRRECETGHRAISIIGTAAQSMGMPINPDPVDVVASLALDAAVLDFGTFEDWAGDYGYDSDSRKAEAIYRACLEIALNLRNALGDAGLQKLRDAAQDY